MLGWLSDRVGRDAALATCMLGGVLGLLAFVRGPGPGWVAAGVLMGGVGSSFFAALDPRFLDNLSDRERVAGFGLVRTVYAVLGSTGSVTVGLLADAVGWAASFLALTGLFAVTLGLLVANAALDLDH